jgi:hypothetical protein
MISFVVRDEDNFLKVDNVSNKTHNDSKKTVSQTLEEMV